MSTSIPEDNGEEESNVQHGRHAVLQQQSSDELMSPPSPAPASGGGEGIISERVNLKENFFLKTEENNFPRNEILQRVNQGYGGLGGSGGGVGGISGLRKPYGQNQQQQLLQRQQFMGNLGYNNNNQFAQNRNLSKVGGTLSAIAENQPVMGTTPEAGTVPSKTSGPSLETSF